MDLATKDMHDSVATTPTHTNHQEKLVCLKYKVQIHQKCKNSKR